MTLIYFERPTLGDTRRIFIGIKYSNKIYRIGFKTIITNNKLEMVRYFYEIKEYIKILDNPDKSLIDTKDLHFLNYFKYKNI
tara:strand:- start:213 stop:458 length:246 start_codon:yes stop_codon:yes gene_type:complete